MNNKFTLGKIKEPIVSYTKGMFLEKIGKIDQAIEQYKMGSDENHEKSQSALGRIYKEAKQYSLSETFYEKSFKNGNIESAFEVGNMYFEKMNYDYGIYWFEKSAREGHLYSQNNLAICHFKKGDYARAKKWLSICSEENLDVALFNLGFLCEVENEIEEAKMFYKKAINYPNAIYNLAIINYYQNNIEESIKLYQNLYKIGFDKACYNFGLILESKKEYEDAKKYYQKSADQGHIESTYRLGNVYDKIQEYEEAEKYYKKAVEKGHLLAKFKLANLYNRKSNIIEAKKYYMESIELPESKNNLASIYFEEKDYQSAINYYLEASSEISVAFENLGDLYLTIGHIESAKEYYMKNSTDVSSQIKLGNLYEEENNYEKAIQWYQKACDNDDFESAYKIAQIFLKLDKPYAANEYLKLAAEYNHVNAKIYLAREFFDKKEYFDARKMFESGANEGSTYCQCMMGIIYQLHNEEYDNSKYWYEKSREKSLDALYNLGLLYMELNDFDTAKKYFKEGLKLNDKKCEYMIAHIYLKRSEDMFRKLSLENYDDSLVVYNQIPVKKIDTKNLSIPSFELIEKNVSKESYIPKYALEINENLDKLQEGKITKMISL